MMTQTIVVLDDHQIFALGLEMMLGTLPDPVACLPRNDAEVAVTEVEAGTLRASLFVVDYYIPGSNAPDLVRRLRAACDTPVLVVSASHNPADKAGALAAGALGFVNKSAPPAEILAALTGALSGQSPTATAALDVLAPLELTPRQIDIVLLVSKGLTNKEIAQMLDVSPETVKTHLKHIFRRLGVSSRVEAVDHLRSIGLA